MLRNVGQVIGSAFRAALTFCSALLRLWFELLLKSKVPNSSLPGDRSGSGGHAATSVGLYKYARRRNFIIRIAAFLGAFARGGSKRSAENTQKNERAPGAAIFHNCYSQGRTGSPGIRTISQWPRRHATPRLIGDESAVAKGIHGQVAASRYFPNLPEQRGSCVDSHRLSYRSLTLIEATASAASMPSFLFLPH
jgi:hypothetical protein